MSEQPAKRTLTTIFYADVADYSRLTGLDEEGTHSRVMAILDSVSQKIGSSGGTVLRYAGDAILATFPSVVQTVTTSIDIQNGLTVDNASLAEEVRVQIRIGIHLGDVIEDRGEVFGDGVNLAARLEAAAEPGGICISSTVWEQCQGKVDAIFSDGGEQQFKNISRPVRTFHWQPDTIQSDNNLGKIERPSSNKPSIAVLPFDNMSGDPEQEYFSDGITEDIITELSRFRSLFVIARNSSFAFKGQAIDITEVGKKLGVKYIVEGSVRKAGNRIRITAQLIEASTGNHLWAERYDRNLDDIFAVQDEVTSQIVTMVPGYVESADQVQAERKPAQDINAYDLLLRALSFLNRNFGSREGEQLLLQALEIDPEYAMPHTYLANFYAFSVFAHGLEFEETSKLSRFHGETALKLAPSDPFVQISSALSYLMVGEHVLAEHHMNKAIALNPNDFMVMLYAAEAMAYLGDYDSAVQWANKAMLNDPYSIDTAREAYFDAHYLGNQYELALEHLVGWQDHPVHIFLAKAAALAQLNRLEEAQVAVQQFEENRPEVFNTSEALRAYARMCAKPEDGERWLDGFRKAGLDI